MAEQILEGLRQLSSRRNAVACSEHAPGHEDELPLLIAVRPDIQLGDVDQFPREAHGWTPEDARSCAGRPAGQRQARDGATRDGRFVQGRHDGGVVRAGVGVWARDDDPSSSPWLVIEAECSTGWNYGETITPRTVWDIGRGAGIDLTVPLGDEDSEVGLESICAAVLVAEDGSTIVQDCSGGLIA